MIFAYFYEFVNSKSIKFTEENFPQINNWLNKGNIALIPTETVYGFSGDPANPEAIKQIQTTKGREEEKPFLLLVDNFETAKKIVEFSDFALRFAKKVWPGACTIILPRKSGALSDFFPNQANLAIRIPDNKNLLTFLQKYWKKPLVSTSANKSGEKTKNDFKSIKNQFDGQKILFCETEKESKNTVPSTIVKIDNEKVEMLREGILLSNKINNIAREILKKN